MRSSTPHHRVIFLFKCCRSQRPGQQEVQLLIILLFFFPIIQAHNDEELGSLSLCIFFVQMLEVPMGTTMKSSAPRHHALLF